MQDVLSRTGVKTGMTINEIIGELDPEQARCDVCGKYFPKDRVKTFASSPENGEPIQGCLGGCLPEFPDQINREGFNEYQYRIRQMRDLIHDRYLKKRYIPFEGVWSWKKMIW